ncbi:MAG TPA: AarF/UbiB family protein [Myxococcota bacterium]|nr:AarF/UbiB family protein [Myxococcota bacterium]
MKLGQALALRFDVLPEDYCLQFFKLLYQMPPFPAEEVRGVVESELGRPLEKLFRRFDFTPIAAASIGQVHRAELQGGAVVAVKVQRPGIRDLVRADLRLMRWIARAIDLVPWLGRPRARRVVDELARWTEEEIDFRNEARNLELLGRNAAGDPLERDPRLYPALTTARVLTLDYLDGVPLIDIVTATRQGDETFLRDLAARGHDLRRIASHITWNALNQIYRQGCFHADPHPANLLVLPGDAIGYVDFGIVGRLDPRATDSLRRFAASLFAGDVERAADEFTGWLVPSRRTDLVAARHDLVEALRRYVESTRVAPDGVAQETLFEVEMFAVVRRHRMALVPHAVLYLKAVLTTEATVKELDPCFDLPAHENEFFERLIRIEALEACDPQRIARFLLDARRRVGDLLDALERGGRVAEMVAEASGVRRSVQVGAALAIAATLVLTALTWAGAPGAKFAAIAIALPAVVLLAVAFREASRLPWRGGEDGTQ